jgi:predicted nucleotidyltransferase
MTTPRIESVIGKILDKLVSEYQPEKVILFGSYAYGTPDADSDIDLFIIKNTSHRFIDRCFEVRKLLTDSSRHIPLEIIVLTPKEVSTRLYRGDQFVEEIIGRGRVLYAA